MKDASRRLNKLRRKIYRETPIATWSSSGSTALALWRSFTKKGFRAWCYEFGFSGNLTHTVTIVETDGLLRIHDAFFNLSYSASFYEVLDALRGGIPIAPKAEIRDRKIYVMDPGLEDETALFWLEANANRELAPIGRLRRFEVLWNVEAFTAVAPSAEAACRELEERGYPRDLRFLMLHPVTMFDGEKSHCDPGTMPLLASRDLRSPLAALRVEAIRKSRELDAERQRVTEKDAAILRVQRECDAANSSWAKASDEARRLGDQIVQLRAALDEETARATVSEAEIVRLREELRDAEARWNAERSSLECSLASVRGTAGLWMEQNSHLVQRLSSELDAAVRELEQAAAERDQIRAELAARMHAWENSRWRKFRAFLMRARPRWRDHPQLAPD
jgi:hypothetical protein